MSDLERLGKALGKDARTNNQNTRRITKLLPYVERKLDVVSSDYVYNMHFPINGGKAATLSLYVKPDNCCECLKGEMAGARKMTGAVIGYRDFVYNQGTPPDTSGLQQSIPGPTSDGLYHQALIGQPISTQGTNDSPWFAYMGYPFFYTLGNYSNFWGNPNNQYGDFSISDQAFVVPTDGVYILKYNYSMTGVTTDTTKIEVSIRRKHINPLGVEEWLMVSKKVFASEYGTMCWKESGQEICAQYGGNGGFNISGTLQAICVQANAGDILAGFVKADDALYWNPDLGGSMEITLIGTGYGVLTGIVRSRLDNSPIAGATVTIEYQSRVEYTDSDGRYTFYSVIPGVHTVTGSNSAYISQTQDVTVMFNEINYLDFSLAPIV
jgi:hypothetical protein